MLCITITLIGSQLLFLVQGLRRDRYRTPMQWNTTGGFVNGTDDPWIPLNPDMDTKNVEVKCLLRCVAMYMHMYRDPYHALDHSAIIYRTMSISLKILAFDWLRVQT